MQSVGRMIWLVVLVLVWAAPGRAAGDGKDLYQKYKCTKCHSIQSQGIVKSEEKDEGEEDELSEEEEEKVEPPDLSGAGKKRDAEWMAKWLRRKLENEEGRKHREKFKGDEGELKTLVEFLSGLKEKSSSGGK